MDSLGLTWRYFWWCPTFLGAAENLGLYSIKSVDGMGFSQHLQREKQHAHVFPAFSQHFPNILGASNIDLTPVVPVNVLLIDDGVNAVSRMCIAVGKEFITRFFCNINPCIHTYVYIYMVPSSVSPPPHGLGPQVVAPIPFYLQAIGSISEVQRRIC